MNRVEILFLNEFRKFEDNITGEIERTNHSVLMSISSSDQKLEQLSRKMDNVTKINLELDTKLTNLEQINNHVNMKLANIELLNENLNVKLNRLCEKNEDLLANISTMKREILLRTTNITGK